MEQTSSPSRAGVGPDQDNSQTLGTVIPECRNTFFVPDADEGTIVMVINSCLLERMPELRAQRREAEAAFLSCVSSSGGSTLSDPLLTKLIQRAVAGNGGTSVGTWTDGTKACQGSCGVKGEKDANVCLCRSDEFAPAAAGPSTLLRFLRKKHALVDSCSFFSFCPLVCRTRPVI